MAERKKILFVGAGGAIAGKLLPGLAKHYDIVGIGGRRCDLATYCTEFISTELTSGAPSLFEDIFMRHAFDGIVWNVVRYHPGPLVHTSRGTLHLEFDLAVALPLECLGRALAHNFSGSFVLVTSGLAFGVKPVWGAYSIVKRGQVVLTEYLVEELRGRVHTKAIALGNVANLPESMLEEVFVHAIENTDPAKTLYKAYGPGWE